ncbi:MAG TPA: nitroreductase [Gemmatimonadaceae bacterium]|jgi:nitroreductase
MSISETIANRRSIKRFTDRAVTREEMEKLLSAATLAPNHKLTQPWRFYVLGPEARYAYGLGLGARKAKKIEDAEKATQMKQNVAEEHRALPAMLVVATVNNPDAELGEEDYAATWMAIENLSLLAVDMGLGTHIKTGAVMADPAARAAVGVKDNERIIAIVNVGEPADVPPPKARESANALTTWTA